MPSAEARNAARRPESLPASDQNNRPGPPSCAASPLAAASRVATVTHPAVITSLANWRTDSCVWSRAYISELKNYHVGHFFFRSMPLFLFPFMPSNFFFLFFPVFRKVCVDDRDEMKRLGLWARLSVKWPPFHENKHDSGCVKACCSYSHTITLFI